MAIRNPSFCHGPRDLAEGEQATVKQLRVKESQSVARASIAATIDADWGAPARTNGG